MMDSYYDKLAQEGTETIKSTTFKETSDLFYKLETDEEQLFSKLRSDGRAQTAIRNNKIADLIIGMNDDDKKKYSYVPDPSSLNRILGAHGNFGQQYKKFYDYDKIATDNGLMTNAELNEIDKNNSAELRRLIEQNTKEGGSKLAAFTGAMLSQLNILNAPENYIPYFGWSKAGATALMKAGRIALESMAIQSALEPVIHDWKSEIDAPYTKSDSATNIGLAGVFGATLSGGLSGIEYIIKNVNISKKDKKIFQDAYDTVKESPFRDEPISDLKVVDNAVPEKMETAEIKKPNEHDIDLKVAKEIEEFQSKLNNSKEPRQPHVPKVEKITAKERVDAIEKDFADELKESKPLDGKQDDLFTLKESDEGITEYPEFGGNELPHIYSLFADVNRKIEIKASGNTYTGKMVSVIPDGDGYSIYLKRHNKSEIEIKKSDLTSIRSIGSYQLNSKYADIESRTRKETLSALIGKRDDMLSDQIDPKIIVKESFDKYGLSKPDNKITLENAILGNKKENAGGSKGVGKKGSKIDKLTFTERKNRSKIEKLDTISDDKIVPLSKILAEADIEIETYKGLKDCIL